MIYRYKLTSILEVSYFYLCKYELMSKWFQYNQNTGKVELDDTEILLVKEFNALLDTKRNKSKTDPTGVNKERAFRELSYIYLAIDWNSPYHNYDEQDRHEAAIDDSGLTESEFNDSTFRNACRKYQELQNSNRLVRMVKAAETTVDKLIDYFESVDPLERDPQTGKPIFKAKDIMGEISKLDETADGLIALEQRLKSSMQESSNIRGDAEEGFDPGDF